MFFVPDLSLNKWNILSLKTKKSKFFRYILCHCAQQKCQKYENTCEIRTLILSKYSKSAR